MGSCSRDFVRMLPPYSESIDFRDFSSPGIQSSGGGVHLQISLLFPVAAQNVPLFSRDLHRTDQGDV